MLLSDRLRKFTSSRFRIRAAMIFYYTLLLSCIPSPVRAEEKEIALPEIISKLEEWRNSFVDLHVTWQLTNMQKKEQSASGDVQPYSQDEWIWSDHGHYLYDTKSLFGKRNHTLDVWNTPQNYAFRANYAQDPVRGEILERLQIFGVASSRPTSVMSIEPLRGLFLPTSGTWLHENLREWDVTVEGTEQVNGTPCVLVSEKSAPSGRSFRWKFWLDASRGFVVKKIVLSISEPQSENEFFVDDYEQLDNGIWFPTKGIFKATKRSLNDPHLFFEWEVTDVVVNSGIDESRFAIPTPDVGTHVTDNLTGRVYRVAYEGERSEIREKIAAAAKRYRAVSGTPATTPPLFSPLLLRWSLILLLAALCLFLVSRYGFQRSK